VADLFSLTQLEDALQQGPLVAASATVARRVAYGWLRSATKLADWPDPVPDDLFAWGLELAGLFYNNPEGLASDTTGATSTTWDRARRAAILDAARSAYGGQNAGGVPLFSFPEPDWSWTVQSRRSC
jgi:hypothetical protein